TRSKRDWSSDVCSSDLDEVLIPSPYWVSYPEQARLVGGVPVEVETREATGFDLDPDQLRAAVGPRTKVIILNSPNNPTGAVFSRSEERRVGKEWSCGGA